MKKLLLFIAALAITSCSSDPIEFANTKPNAKIYAELIPGGVISSLPDSWEIALNGNVLDEIKINTNFKDEMIYSSNQLMEVHHYSLNSNNATLLSVDNFEYNSNDKIEKITNRNQDGVITSIRTFNYTAPEFIEDKTVFYSSGTISSSYTAFKKIINGNVVESKDEYGNEQNYFTYDTKKNIFSDLQNLDNLVLYYSNKDSKVNKNNKLNSNSVFTFNNTILNTIEYSYFNQYDSDNKITITNYAVDGITHYKVNYTY